MISLVTAVLLLATPTAPVQSGPDGGIPSGFLTRGSTITLEAGMVLTPIENLTVFGAEDVVIDGNILAQPRGQDTGSTQGVTISISASRSIHIRGVVLAGTGGIADPITLINDEGMAGGTGGNIHLDAPLVVIEGSVIAGMGGLAGPHREGPPGGDIVIVGRCVASEGTVRIIGGKGGSGAKGIRHDIPAGRGGPGGTTLFLDHAIVLSEKESAAALGLTGKTNTDPQDLGEKEDCGAGSAGGNGVISYGGISGVGSAGANGTSMSQQGQTGGPGGAGNTATATSASNNGVNGGNGKNCCPEKGGLGGKGGSNGGIGGGMGGTGGIGGDGYFDPVTMQYTGPAGHGGAGEPAGNGVAGTVGNGGNGGTKTGNKGMKGEPLVIPKGAQGLGGAPGHNGSGGSPMSGRLGAEGQNSIGGGGSDGNRGGPCPDK